MSLAFCYDCLKAEDIACECGNPSRKVIYGINRVNYMEGYRDAKKGKEPDVQVQQR